MKTGGKARQKRGGKDGGAWHPGLRKHDPLEVLADAEHGRVRRVLPLRTERMCASAFGFFRGAAALMAYDLALLPHSGVVNQICGDAHVQNLGAYAGIDGKLIFDVNDFDETIRGPFEWDVRRMTTSLLLAGEQAGVGEAGRQSAVTACLEAYEELVHCLAPLPVLEVARYEVRRLHGAAPVAALLQLAERASPVHLRDKLTKPAKGSRVFCETPGLLWRVGGEERSAVLASLDEYRDSLLPERQHFFDGFRPLDVAFKVVGTGSVGLRDYVVYCEGNGADDPLFVQVKQEVRSAYAAYLPKGASAVKHDGRRVADGQRAMQLQSDPLLGWTTVGKRDYLVRQLNDHKASLDVTTLDAEALAAYARVCGEMLARGHARSGSARAIVAYVAEAGGKRFRHAMERFAGEYAAQSVADWKALVASVEPPMQRAKKVQPAKQEGPGKLRKRQRLAGKQEQGKKKREAVA